ncbi:hypothetical protein B0H11DRAFT_2294984 [Mycena galericulata]|nr:hypothetical protein B0H11DRAFT_2294984 [Mycena galericulata]
MSSTVPHSMHRFHDPIEPSATSTASEHLFSDSASSQHAEFFKKLDHEPEVDWFRTSAGLRWISAALHSFLVALHLALLAIWTGHLEHGAVFVLDQQKTVSFLIAAISTSFVTIYSSVMVVVVQTLAMRLNLHSTKTLTAAHDTASAWAGIGSAVLSLLGQRSLRSSLVGVLSAVLYLGNIMVLHVTTPALFSVQTFNSTRSIPVQTQSLVDYKTNDTLASFLNDITLYAASTLPILPFLGNLTVVGLDGATLYDVLPPNPGTGEVSVNATTFNMTCGYIMPEEVGISMLTGIYRWEMSLRNNITFALASTDPGLLIGITALDFADSSKSNGVEVMNSILLYSTIPIHDSYGNMGAWIELTTPMNSSVAAIQLLQCSQSLITHHVLVDSQSGAIIPGGPSMLKTSSIWFPSDGPSSFIPDNTLNLLFQTWGLLFGATGLTTIQLETVNPSPSDQTGFLTPGDEFLNNELNLLGANPPASLALYEVENALGTLMASIFGILGHIPAGDGRGTANMPHPFLQQGSAVVPQIFTEIRLDLNIIAVLVGLAVSIILSVLSIPFSVWQNARTHFRDTPLDGTGFLHAIWLYRNDPELENALVQVRSPSDDNLREAGMVEAFLVSGRARSLCVLDTRRGNSSVAVEECLSPMLESD